MGPAELTRQLENIAAPYMKSMGVAMAFEAASRGISLTGGRLKKADVKILLLAGGHAFGNRGNVKLGPVASKRPPAIVKRPPSLAYAIRRDGGYERPRVGDVRSGPGGSSLRPVFCQNRPYRIRSDGSYEGPNIGEISEEDTEEKPSSAGCGLHMNRLLVGIRDNLDRVEEQVQGVAYREPLRQLLARNDIQSRIVCNPDQLDPSNSGNLGSYDGGSKVITLWRPFYELPWNFRLFLGGAERVQRMILLHELCHMIDDDFNHHSTIAIFNSRRTRARCELWEYRPTVVQWRFMRVGECASHTLACEYTARECIRKELDEPDFGFMDAIWRLLGCFAVTLGILVLLVILVILLMPAATPALTALAKAANVAAKIGEGTLTLILGLISALVLELSL